MAMQQVEFSMDDQVVLDSIPADHEKSRPKVTTNSYKGPQKEYKDLCLKRAFERDGRPPLEKVDEVKRNMEETNR
ncbi:hypothetical protein QFC19_009480 [Naganishia cerealis]|uniref:Uncharacterized protein n=1 Tax=Naganishia cerealis TaxID=610337 RepID=A0ACC2UVU5_9TREE|nr:hypothetical protein QFC19_009480 [Naganishia cerealis]